MGDIFPLDESNERNSFSSDYYEEFYCQRNPNGSFIEPIIEFPVHHSHFRILTKIMFVKIALFENRNAFYTASIGENTDELDSLINLNSWEAKIIYFSGKIYFNELSKKELSNLNLDFNEIKSDCNWIWKNYINWNKDIKPGVGDTVWALNRKGITNKYKKWKEFWGKVWYHKKDKIFQVYSPLGPNYGKSDCYNMDGSPSIR